MNEEEYEGAVVSNVLGNYSSNWCDKILEIKKWKNKD